MNQGIEEALKCIESVGRGLRNDGDVWASDTLNNAVVRIKAALAAEKAAHAFTTARLEKVAAELVEANEEIERRYALD